MTSNTPARSNRTIYLWLAAAACSLGLLFARVLYSDVMWLTAIVAFLLVVALVALIRENRKALRGRAAAFGLNSIVTVVLVVAITGVVNFMASRYPGKLDLTRSKIHSLADQTTKLVKGLNRDVKAVYYGKLQHKEKIRPLLENLKGLNPKFEIEWVDPDRELARAKQVGIRKYETLQLVVGTKDTKIEDPTEEKITNALIKLLKDKTLTVCATTGHGEKSFAGADAEGYQAVKQGLGAQAYDQKDVLLMQEGKIPDYCDALAIVGPNKAFFPLEITLIRDYLAKGGRALVALDLNVKGADQTPELVAVLNEWHVKPGHALILDPLSRIAGQDAAVSLVGAYSKENPITKELQESAFMPLARPIEVVPNAPAGMNVTWLTQTTNKAWGETDMKELLSGRVAMTEGKDQQGPMTTSIAVSGKLKDSKAEKATRLVVFGTSLFATNNFTRFGANLDLVLNSITWLLDDENLISIRVKEEAPSKIDLSERQQSLILLITVLLVPILITIMGIVIWAVRRRL